MKYIVVDCETNIANRGEGAVGDMLASPHSVSNNIVALGVRSKGSNTLISNPEINSRNFLTSFAVEEPILIVGHNIGFDIHYLAKTFPDWWETNLERIYIWDTQQVAYLLSGQTHIYPALDELCEEIGYELKDSKIKQYWKDGIDTADIPPEELLPYLEHDLEATDVVFQQQLELVKKDDALFNLVRVKMDDILCTTMMERNGMHFDVSLAWQRVEELEAEYLFQDWMAQSCVADAWHEDSGVPFNPLSPEHVSIAMFGGSYKVEYDQEVVDPDTGEVVRYKSGARKGEKKTRRAKREVKVAGMTEPPPGVTRNKRGMYSTDDEILSNYMHLPFVQHILNLRALNKEITTYYRGYSSLVWPDGKIHPSINHSSTRTGRQSCTKPNLQNVTRDDE